MGLGVDRLGGPVGVEGVDNLGRVLELTLTLGRLGGGGALPVTRGDGELMPFCVAPAAASKKVKAKFVAIIGELSKSQKARSSYVFALRYRIAIGS